MLTQKIALEANERSALAVANRSYVCPDRGVFRRPVQATTGTWRFASTAFQELECGLAKRPGRLQTQGMRGVGKDDPLYVR
jgi:hypothetical protein